MHATSVPLNIIIGFSPGSASDDIAHLIAKPLAEQLQREITFTRIAGESGTLGARAVAHAAADGNTVFIATLGTHALAPHARPDCGYDALNDFAPVTLLTESPMLLACHPSLPAQDAQGFVTYAHAHPSQLAYGTSALGGAPHLAAELFQRVTHTALTHARYDDTRTLYDDLEAGRIALSFNNVMSMLPRCASGTLRALGVTAPERLAAAPHIPTLAECGIADCEVSNWVGLVAPRGTPGAAVATLSQAASIIMQSPAIAEPLKAAGITPCGNTPADFARYMADELQRWGPMVRQFSRRADSRAGP